MRVAISEKYCRIIVLLPNIGLHTNSRGVGEFIDFNSTDQFFECSLFISSYKERKIVVYSISPENVLTSSI